MGKDFGGDQVKRSTRQLTEGAFTLALLVVGGAVLYYLSALVPIPGSKFLLMAPYLSLALYAPVKRAPKPGVISIINLGFAALLSFFSVFMGLAIALSGILTDLTTVFLFRAYDRPWKRRWGIAFYPAYAFLTSLFITDFITGRHLYGTFGPWPIFIGALMTYALGYGGALLGEHIGHRLNKMH